MLTDDDLVEVMLGPDAAFATVATRIFIKRHADDPPIREPAHCDECFEGCPKCT